MGNFKPYEKYKESNTPWLGNIPEHWTELPIQAMTKTKSIKGRADLPLLSVYRDYGVILKSSRDDNHNRDGADLSTYKVVKPDDLVLNKMKTWQGSLGVAENEGIVSPAYIVCKLYGDIVPRYIHHLLRSKPYIAFYNQYSYGVRVDQWDMRYNSFKRLPVFLPSVDEQDKIVKFITAKEKQIKKFIKNKKKLIKLLTEQKQGIINQAVTKGLDPNVPLKASGVDWLGDIPEHWEVKPLKHWVKINEKTLTEANSSDLTINYIDIGSVSTGYLVEKPQTMSFKDAPSRARRVIKQGDTIISTVRTYLKAIYYVDLDTENLIASTGFAVLSPKDNINKKFFSFVIQSKPFIERVVKFSIGVAYPAINESKLGTFHIALPPDYEEQENIVKTIEKETEKIDYTISRAEKEIDLIQEYRTRLISDVVTGKIDVRDIFIEESDLEITDIEEELESIEDSENTEDTEKLEVEYA